MVLICDKPHSNTNYNSYFENYPFPLSDFQKHAIEGIVNNNHVLVTAHTGSGKTLPAEFAINHFCAKGKKVIYTSPIKALSNEKYHDFCKKFPDYSIGILTGDIKFNPDGDLLIMTTEILQNHLYKRKQAEESKLLQTSTQTNNALSFDMNIDDDLACVIFDEIHYINDADRGKVWEETILMLPQHVSMVMLSATIDKPDAFAGWCENRYENDTKKVILTGTNHRVVPLKHYIYVDSSEHYFKLLKDKDKEREIKNFIRTPQLIKEGNKIFETVIHKSNKLINEMVTKGSFTKPPYILNAIIKYLYQENMLPAICFVFSRLNVEKYANQIQVNLFDEEDAHIPSIIPEECDKIIRKLPNYEEYKQLDEYVQLVKLMSKGVAIHHSGMMPILREMVEIIFGKRYIKVLFATETFAVGINMPTKTVIFTSLTKYTSQGVRNLHSHEYTQMAGRAGRRGLDTVGYVIHCNNMFREPMLSNDYKKILSGTPQTLESKFKISYSLLLNLISIGNNDYCRYIESSMLSKEVMKYAQGYENQKQEYMDLKHSTRTSIDAFNCDIHTVEKYIDIKEKLPTLQNKKKKNAYRELEQIENMYGKNFKRDLELIQKLRNLNDSIQQCDKDIRNVKSYIEHNVQHVINILYAKGFVEYTDDIPNLTPKGVVASGMHETHPLILAEMITDESFTHTSIENIVGFFSSFTNVTINDQYKTGCKYPDVTSLQNKYNLLSDYYTDVETEKSINTGHDFEIHTNIVNETIEWCMAENEEECKVITQKMNNKEIFVGEFVKAILKINNVANECMNACEMIGNMALAEKLSKISDKTLKYIILQQSLYV